MINLKPIGNYLHTKKYYFTASIPYIYPPSLVLSMYIIICNKNVGYEIWYGYWVFINFIHNTIHEHDSSRDGHPPCLLQCRRCVQLLRLLLFHRRQEPPLQPCCRPHYHRAWSARFRLRHPCCPLPAFWWNPPATPCRLRRRKVAWWCGNPLGQTHQWRTHSST